MCMDGFSCHRGFSEKHILFLRLALSLSSCLPLCLSLPIYASFSQEPHLNSSCRLLLWCAWFCWNPRLRAMVRKQLKACCRPPNPPLCFRFITRRHTVSSAYGISAMSRHEVHQKILRAPPATESGNTGRTCYHQLCAIFIRGFSVAYVKMERLPVWFWIEKPTP